MGKKLLLSLTAFAMLATPAWAQYMLRGTNTDDYGAGGGTNWVARENFGTGSDEVAFTLSGVTIELSTDLSSAAIGPATRNAELEFCLDDGAVFAEAVPGLVFLEGSPNNSSNLISSIRTVNGGGNIGDSCVTYSISNGTNTLNNAETTYQLTLPKVKGLSFLGRPDAANRADPETPIPPRGTMSVTLTPMDRGALPGTTGFARFPPADAAAGTNKRTITQTADRFSLAVTPMAQATGAPPTVLVDLNDRTMFASGEGIENDRVTTITGIGNGADRMGILLSTVQITKNERANGPDGSFDIVSGGAGDKLDITVESSGMSFTDTSLLFLSSDTAYNRESDITLNVSGSTASSSAELANFVTSEASGAGTLMSLYYVPASGRALMRDAAFTSTYAVNFAANTKQDSMETAAAVTLELQGLSTRGYAYAIPNNMAPDVGNLRIRCEDAMPCTVFLECTDPRGEAVGVGGFVALDPISPGMTEHLDSGELTDMLGNWNGRISCEVVSSGPVGVQILTRNRASGTLVNNTYINREGGN